MGSGIGGAIGLGVAPDPSNPIVLIVGDGWCMQMYGMELLVAVKYRLPIIFAVMNDGRYNIVKHGMHDAFGVSDDYDFPVVDFVKFATSMGAFGIKIEEGKQLCSELVNEIRTDPDYFVSRVASLKAMFFPSHEGSATQNIQM